MQAQIILAPTTAAVSQPILREITSTPAYKIRLPIVPNLAAVSLAAITRLGALATGHTPARNFSAQHRTSSCADDRTDRFGPSASDLVAE